MPDDEKVMPSEDVRVIDGMRVDGEPVLLKVLDNLPVQEQLRFAEEMADDSELAADVAAEMNAGSPPADVPKKALLRRSSRLAAKRAQQAV